MPANVSTANYYVRAIALRAAHRGLGGVEHGLHRVVAVLELVEQLRRNRQSVTPVSEETKYTVPLSRVR